MDQLAYYQSHHPRCIAGFHVSPVTFPDVQFDGHGEELNPPLHCNASAVRLIIASTGIGGTRTTMATSF